MSGFVSSLTELGALVFESFRLPALLPALLFMVTNAALVLPGLRETPLGRIYYAQEPTGQALLLVLATAFVTYMLSALNLSIIRCLEGYSLLESPVVPGRWIKGHHEARFTYLCDRRRYLERELPGVRARERGSAEHAEMEAEYVSVLTELANYYPSRRGRILPTRLGNVIAAAEDYPYVVYQMDAVALWPRLAPILTEQGYSKFIEREKGSFDFLVNTLLLSTILGLEVTLSGWLQLRSPRLAGLQLLAVMTAALVFYRLSVDGAMGWATTIRVSFDLYRDHLAKALRIGRPKDFWAERRYWRLVSEFYAYGWRSCGQEIFDYRDEAYEAALGAAQQRKDQESNAEMVPEGQVKRQRPVADDKPAGKAKRK